MTAHRDSPAGSPSGPPPTAEEFSRFASSRNFHPTALHPGLTPVHAFPGRDGEGAAPGVALPRNRIETAAVEQITGSKTRRIGRPSPPKVRREYAAAAARCCRCRFERRCCGGFSGGHEFSPEPAV